MLRAEKASAQAEQKPETNGASQILIADHQKTGTAEAVEITTDLNFGEGQGGPPVTIRLKHLQCLARNGLKAPETMLAKVLRVVETC